MQINDVMGFVSQGNNVIPFPLVAYYISLVGCVFLHITELSSLSNYLGWGLKDVVLTPLP